MAEGVVSSAADEKVLGLDDAVDLLERLLPAQNDSYELGLRLRLPPHDVEGIHSRYSNPKSRLLQILLGFLNQVEPRPTWRFIVDALRSPAVNLPRLAKELETDYLLPKQLPGTDVQSVSPVEPPTPTDQLYPRQTSSEAGTGMEEHCSPMTERQHRPASPIPHTMTSHYVQAKIRRFEKRFNELKKATRLSLEKRKISVKLVADALTSLPADDFDEHKQFLESHLSVLYESPDLSQLFGALSFNWNYLSYQLLDYLIKEFELDVKNEMDAYKKDLQQFREKTPLTLFCQSQKKRRVRPSQEFQEVVAEFDWPDDVTLEVVEQFRQEYAYHYNLRECAMLLAVVLPGSFIVTWFIPESIVEKLKSNFPMEIFRKYKLSKLQISGESLPFSSKPEEEPSELASTNQDAPETFMENSTPLQSAVTQVVEEEYWFVEKPTDDYFCPVTTNLLTKPHLTGCCGKHLSEEAVTIIKKEEGKGCPLCKEAGWSTLLDKHFRRQVHALCVYCRHVERGCEWEGELSSLQSHVQSCSSHNAPLITDPLSLPVRYKGRSSSGRSCKLTVDCHQRDAAPGRMYSGSATTDQQFAYFAPDCTYSVYSYDWASQKWRQLPQCPHRDSALVVIDRTLNAVGGWSDSHYTNKILTLVEEQWVEKYPPMTVPRSRSSVVSTSDGDHLIVIGGFYDDWIRSVELFTVRGRRWFELLALPHPLSYPSAAIHSDQVHVIGSDADGYTCSLETLPPTKTIDSIPHVVAWKPLPPLPVTDSTAAVLSGSLVIIGGIQNESSSRSIRQLVSGRWEEIGSTSSGRYRCLAVTPSPDKMMIVGGWHLGTHDSVEGCVLAA